MKVNMLSRPRVNAGDVGRGCSFKMVGKPECYMVVDLTNADFNTGPILREDVVYCVNLETGVIEIVQRTIEVESVTLNVDEVPVIL